MNRISFAAAAVIAFFGATAAQAAEIKVLTAGAFKPIVTAVVPEFERESGHKVVVDNDTVGGLLRRVSAGESFDVIVATPAALDALTKDGKLTAASATRVARVGIGVAIKDGANTPDVSTVESFKNALLSARAVAYIDPAAGGSSGIYFSQWLEKAGIAEQVRAKAVLVPGGLVAQRLLNGQADIAIHQISEILAVPGAKLVGPIPREIQNFTVYSGGIHASPRNPDAAKAFLAVLTSSKTQAVLRDKGMETP